MTFYTLSREPIKPSGRRFFVRIEGPCGHCSDVDALLVAQAERRLLSASYDRRRCSFCHRLFHRAVRKPNIPEVRPFAQRVYDSNSMGCCLHIVLDDGHVRDDNVSFCVDAAQQKEHADCLQLAKLLLRMSKTQRLKLGSVVVDRNPSGADKALRALVWRL